METEKLSELLLKSPLAKQVEREESARINKERREHTQAMKVEEETYEVARTKLDTAIKATQADAEKLEERLVVKRQELIRLHSQGRIVAVDHDRVIGIHMDQLSETADPCIKAAINECYQKISESRLSKAVVAGSTQTRPDLYGFIKQTTWSNLDSLENYREIIRGVQVQLEAMKFAVDEDALGQVNTLMSRIPRLDFAAPVQEEGFSPEARRLESQRAMKGNEGLTY